MQPPSSITITVREHRTIKSGDHTHDALTSARPYKSPMSVGDALHVLAQESGHHFDPAMIAVFAEIAPLVNAQFVVADAKELRLRMRLLLARYFETEAAPEGAASRSALGET